MLSSCFALVWNRCCFPVVHLSWVRCQWEAVWFPPAAVHSWLQVRHRICFYLLTETIWRHETNSSSPSIRVTELCSGLTMATLTFIWSSYIFTLCIYLHLIVNMQDYTKTTGRISAKFKLNYSLHIHSKDDTILHPTIPMTQMHTLNQALDTWAVLSPGTIKFWDILTRRKTCIFSFALRILQSPGFHFEKPCLT